MSRNPDRPRVLASVITAVALLASFAGVSHARGVRPATYTGTNGPFVYLVGTFSGMGMTFTPKASDASGNAVTVSLGATSEIEFSPDGSKAVWVSANGTSTWSIKMANSNGTNEVTVLNVTSGANVGNNNINPTFSPDGSFIAFAYNNDVYQIASSSTNKALSDATKLTNMSAGETADFARYVSNTRLAFVSMRSGGSCSGTNGIYIKDTAVSGNGTLLTNSCLNGAGGYGVLDLDVSPDGQWIAFRGPTGAVNFIGLIKSDNTGSRVVAYTGAGGGTSPQGRPSFSPDGTKIAYGKGPGSYVTATWNGSTGTVGSETAITFPAGVNVPAVLTWAPASAVLSGTTSTTAPATTTTTAPTTTTTTVAATTTTTIPRAAAALTAKYESATPGVTVTDNKVYTEAPAEVADDSAIRVLSIAQNKTFDIETRTPGVCLPNDDELVFLNEGTCIATVVNARTRAALRTVRTTVVSDDITEVKVGNAVVTLAPVYFKQMSRFLDDRAQARIEAIKKQANAAGSVLVVGYSGTRNGNSPENKSLSRARALSTVTALKLAGVEGPFAVSGVGALDPVSRGTSEADQAKNRRVVIVLVP